METLLHLENVKITLPKEKHPLVGPISFQVDPGQVVALVGESGCGKSVTSLSILGLLEGAKVEGRMEFDGIDLTALSEKEYCALRGKQIAMIFQEPMTALNPVLTVAHQLREVAGEEDCLKMLSLVGIANPERVYHSYPHQLSGGLRQRVVIAMALLGHPKLILADEPTTALDVTVQDQILKLLKTRLEEAGSAMILVTHDLSVVAEMAQKVVVMYAGKVVEKGPVEDIFFETAHPYTLGLLAAKPVVGQRKGRLQTIPGTVPDLHTRPKGCPFVPRCPWSTEICTMEFPGAEQIGKDHFVYCYHWEEAQRESDKTAGNRPS